MEFIKTMLFGCETKSLIVVITLFAGFVTFSNTTLSPSPPAEEAIYSTLHPNWEIDSWYHLAVGMGGVHGN